MFRLSVLAVSACCFLFAGCKSEEKNAGKIIESPNPEAFARILKDNPVVLVDFSATWCGPCKRMKPIIQELEEDYRGKVAVVVVDVDRQPGLADEYGVRGVPHFVVFRDGKPAESVSGVVPRGQLVYALERQLRPSK